MTLEEFVFEKHSPNFAALEKFGFGKNGKEYRFSALFMDGAFRADITVSEKGAVAGRVYDAETDDEYLPLRRPGGGAYAGTVREAYLNLLREIANRCFVNQPFRHSQANRLAAELKERFGDDPDYPFKDKGDKEDRTIAVFRRPDSKKWYGIVMNVRRSLLDKSEKQENTEKTEIMNVKAAPEKIPELTKENGIYPAYHMNKKNWITIVLDGSLPDEKLFCLVSESRDMVKKGKAAASSSARNENEPKSWVIPSNPDFFDIYGEFDRVGHIDWHQDRNVLPGDTVYIYLCAPYSAIIFRCRVTETNIPGVRNGKKIVRMRIVKECQYAPDKFNRAVLKQYGLTSVRCARGIPEKLREELERDFKANAGR